MSSIYVHMGRIREANYALPDVESKVRLVRKRIQRTRSEIPDYISAKYRIGQRLNDVCKEIDGLGNKISDLYEVINICMDQYTFTENENSRNAEAFY